MLNDRCQQIKACVRLAGLMEFILIVGTALALIPAPGFAAPKTCLVTVSVDPTQADPAVPGKGISYNITNVTGNSCQKTDGHKLFLNQNDYVQWAVTETGAPPASVQLTVTFKGSAPDTTHQAYSGPGGASFPASAVPLPIDKVTYQYDIAVFDGKNTYTDDPKIVVGTGMNLLWDAWMDEWKALQGLREASDDFREAAARNPQSRQRLQEELKTLGRIEGELQKLLSKSQK